MEVVSGQSNGKLTVGTLSLLCPNLPTIRLGRAPRDVHAQLGDKRQVSGEKTRLPNAGAFAGVEDLVESSVACSSQCLKWCCETGGGILCGRRLGSERQRVVCF